MRDFDEISDEMPDEKTPQEICNEFIKKYSGKDNIIQAAANIKQLEEDLKDVTNAFVTSGSMSLTHNDKIKLQETLAKMVQHIPPKKEYNKAKRLIVGFFEKFLPDKMPEKVMSWQRKIQSYKSAKSARAIIESYKETIDSDPTSRRSTGFGKPKTASTRAKH